MVKSMTENLKMPRPEFSDALTETISVASEGDDHIHKVADHVFTVPDTIEPLQPLLTVIPLQLLAYHAAVTRGCNVDKPRNLAKSVTVE